MSVSGCDAHGHGSGSPAAHADRRGAGGQPDGGKADMRRAVYEGNRTFTVQDAEPDTPGEGEVTLAVAYTGICGTDLHILHGAMDHRVDTPAVVGHEMSGSIARVGPGVEGWS